MTPRTQPFGTHFGLVKPLIAFGNAAQDGLDTTLAELIKIRASQINGCGACLTMHVREARGYGETEERIYMLDAWRESSLYTDRERAALAWTEALTRMSEDGASDEVYEDLRMHFSEEAQIQITLLIGAINAFNRLNVGLRVRLPDSVDQKAA